MPALERNASTMVLYKRTQIYGGTHAAVGRAIDTGSSDPCVEKNNGGCPPNAAVGPVFRRIQSPHSVSSIMFLGRVVCGEKRQG